MKEPTESKKKKIRQLLEQFYQENKDIISKKDYEKAKDSPEYFLHLIKSLTKAHYGVANLLLANLDIDKTHPQ
ncbi:MAG: hypothetical protein ABIF87_11175 [Pseudomonadota bacterium]